MAASFFNLRPTASAALPPTPASTSSKTKVRGVCFKARAGAAQVLRASAMRDSSPPEAIRSSGLGSSPALGEIRISTASAPDSDQGAGETRISTRVFSMASEASSCFNSLATAGARRRVVTRSAGPRPPRTRHPKFQLLSAAQPGARLNVSTAASWRRASSRNASTSAIVEPYLRFSFSSAARRDSISSSRAGSASSFAR